MVVAASPNVRRSGRERKKPDLLMKKSTEEKENEEQESDSDDSDESDSVIIPQKRKKKSSPSRTRKKQKPIMEDSEEEEEGGCSQQKDHFLFNALSKPNSAVKTIVSDWKQRFSKDAETATLELINFILLSCNVTTSSLMKSVNDFESLELEDLVDTLSFKAGTSTSYPIKQKRFQSAFQRFWTLWSTSNTTLLERVIEWLSSLAIADIVPIRHTATVASYAICSAIVKHYEEISNSISVASRQLKSSKKKSKKSDALSTQLQEFTDSRETLSQFVRTIFDNIWAHRYRDVRVFIRRTSIEALTHWIITSPDLFKNDSHLKYYGWLLNDKDASVRCLTLDSLQLIYESDDDDNDKLLNFTNRFVSRFLEMVLDVDPSVALSAIKLLTLCDKREMLDEEELDLSVLESRVFDTDTSESVRSAAADFVCLQYDAFGVMNDDKKKVAGDDDDDITTSFYQTQLLALIEFISSSSSSSNELAIKAFWNSDDCTCLQEWRVMANMLLSEEDCMDDDDDTCISQEQQQVLVTILCTSVLIASKEEKLKEKLTTELFPIFSKLLKKYNSSALSSASLLLIPRVFILDKVVLESKVLLEIVNTIIQMFFTSSSNSDDKTLRQEIVKTLYDLASKDHVQKSLVNSAVSQGVSTSVSNVISSLDDTNLSSSVSRLASLVPYFSLSLHVDRDVVTTLSSDLYARMSTTTTTDNDDYDDSNMFKIVFYILLWESIDILRRHEEEDEDEDIAVAISDAVSDRIVPLKEDFESFVQRILEEEENAEMKKQCVTYWTLWTSVWSGTIVGNSVKYSDVYHKLIVTNQQSFTDIGNYVKQYFEETVLEDDSLIKMMASSALAHEDDKLMAALVMTCISNTNTTLVKAFCKECKKSNGVRYLEILMTCLRQAYQNNTNADVSLSKKLASTLGVGKITSRELIKPFVRFMNEGVRFSLSDGSDEHFSFLAVMKPFVRFLSDIGRREVRNKFTTMLSELVQEDPSLQERMDNDSSDNDNAIAYLLDFQSSLKRKGRAALAPKTTLALVEEEDDEIIDENIMDDDNNEEQDDDDTDSL